MPPLYLRVFERLILEANHAETTIPYRIRDTGTVVQKKVNRGERITSIRQICKWVGWYEKGILREPNPKTISEILGYLEDNSMIEIYRDKGNRQDTHYKLCNYEYYQGAETIESNGRVTKNKQSTDTNKNVENDNNDNKIIHMAKASRFTPPTLEEVTAYCKERNRGVDPIKWWNFYDAKNWYVGKNKMARWKSAVITWEDKPEEQPPEPKKQKQYRQEIINGEVVMVEVTDE